MPNATQSRSSSRALANLLLVVAGLVFAMVVIGGITRLTESGLSITEWKPIIGAIPPLSHADWERAFDLYRQTPQYREVAGPAGMTLSGFKFIFFWEWVHRLLGRVLGLVFFVGVGWFAVKRGISARLRLAARGFVHSGRAAGRGRLVHGPVGLEGRTEVSPYRLSAHLLFALFLFAALIWTALDLRRAEPVRRALPHGAWSRLPPSSSS